MNTRPKYIPKEKTAARVPRRFFSHTPGADAVHPEGIYAACGRGDRPMDKNRIWLYQRIAVLKYYEGARTDYSQDRRLGKVVLTPREKAALQGVFLQAGGGGASVEVPAEVPARVRRQITLKSMKSIGVFLKE